MTCMPRTTDLLALPRRRVLAMLTAVAGLAAFALPAPAQERAIKQIRLTEKQLQNFIAAQKEMTAAVEKMAASGAPDAASQSELDVIARKYGFKDYGEFD